MTSLKPVFDYLEHHETQALARLLDYLRHKSISAENIGIRGVAALLQTHLSTLGFDAELLESAGHPFVYGRYDVGVGRPTVLIYGHYDVQPADPIDEWISPPFEPTLRDGRIYARGAGDNKGQHFAWLLALEAWLKVHDTLPCNVIFLLEGEEEIGSPHIAKFVRGNADRLNADLVITSDGPLHESGDPAIIFGVRGVVSFDLVATGANRDAHSGNFGGILPSPAWELVHLLATMKDKDGNITIEGIADAPAPATTAERAAIENLPFDEAAMFKEMGISAMEGPEARPYWDRLMFHPTLTINGLNAGYCGPGTKTVLPNRAVAKCDVRLVEPMTADFVLDRIRAHIAKHAPGIELVVMEKGMLPSKTPMDSPWAPAIAAGIEAARGKPPLLYPSLGGSLPEYVWTKILKKPAFVVPFANHDEANHAPNENIELVRFLDGIRCGAAILEELGRMTPPG